ncbi:P44/Msp2 family outer membrane protein [Anaplasma capra]|uniref:P44/Msp2 family outer membrane protein n=1 Tax=Anaplasma capra TaxID=1562740 RepID=UPI0021D61225|nr:P44/Msp2 family outer membrane protein [Anaplasma capra]MCU7611140.1 P44/Msp2 family outer membrane protein [Anaplasma capra]MCU7612356.1 P44/Msp2 family outer membrane protein [Anaplasma capra]
MLRSFVGATFVVLLFAVFLLSGAGFTAGLAGGSGFYLGLGYAPSWGGARDLYVGTPGNTWYVLPYRKDACGSEALSWSGFDWFGTVGGAPGDAPVKFRDVSLRGVSGAIGYALSENSRVELEVAREEFPIAKVGSRCWKKGDAWFLLLGPEADLTRRSPRVVYDGTMSKDQLDKLVKSLRRGLDGLLGEDLAEANLSINLMGSALLTPGGAQRTDVPSSFTSKLDALLKKVLPRVWPHLPSGDKELVLSTLDGSYGSRSEIIDIPAIELTTVEIAGCRDFALSNLSTIAIAQGATVYSCASMGAGFVQAAGEGVAEFSLGARFGVSYRLSPAASVFVGGAVRRTLDCDLGVPVTPIVGGKAGAVVADLGVKGEARLSFGVTYFAGEIGLRFLI